MTLEIDIKLNEVVIDGKFKSALFVEHLLSGGNKSYFKTPVGPKGGDVVWFFNEELGIWQDNGISWVEVQLDRVLDKKSAARYFPQVMKLVQVRTYVQSEEFREDPSTIVLKNGEFNLDTQTLGPYEPNHNHKGRLPIKYDPNAIPTRSLKFFDEVLPREVDAIQDLFGFLLDPTYDIQVYVIFVGEGNNGKSTILLLMIAFLGEENCSGESLYELSTDPYSKAQLAYKMANIAPDIGADELKRTSAIKELTGGDRMRARHIFQAPFYYWNRAKLFFSCNQVPKSPDVSKAFFRRFQSYFFNQSFEGAKRIPQKELLAMMTTEEELSGLFNFALGGFMRIKKTGQLTGARTTEEKQKLYTEMSDPVTAFKTALLKDDPEAVTAKDDLYRAYVSFCKGKGYIAKNDTQFFKDLRPMLYVDEIRVSREVNKLRPRAWKGVKLAGPDSPSGPRPTMLTVKNEYRERNIEPGPPGLPGPPIENPTEEIIPELVEGDPPPPPPEDHTCEACGSPASFRYAARWLCKKHLDEMIRADRDMGGASA